MIDTATTETLQLTIGGDPLVVDIYAPPAETGQLPVLLLHGWGGSGRYWQPTIERLRAEHTLIVPDLPGVGRSLPVSAARTIFDQASVVEQLLAHLEIGRVMLVGHSMGAGIAIVLAARRPELIDRLVLVGVSLFRNDIERTFFNSVTEVAGLMMRFRPTLLADLPLLTQQFATRFFHRVPDDPQLLREGFLDYLTMDYETALASARSASDPRINAAARKIACPTLIVAPRQDRVMPTANLDVTIEAIAGAQLRWIEECGHIPMVEKADEFAEVVRAFLA
jgi:pimeloyl-ACP methyl ester carboxylesterase